MGLSFITSCSTVKAVNWKKVSRETYNFPPKVTVPKNTKFVVYQAKKHVTHEIYNIVWLPQSWDTKGKWGNFSSIGTGTFFDNAPTIRHLTSVAAETDASFRAWHGIVLVAEGSNSSVMKKAPEGIQGAEAPYRLVYYIEGDSVDYPLEVDAGYLPESVLKKNFRRGKGDFNFWKLEDGAFVPYEKGVTIPIVKGNKVEKGFTTLRHLEWNAQKFADDYIYGDAPVLNPYTGPINTKKQRHSAEYGILEDIESYDITKDPEETLARAKQGLKRLGYSDSKIQEILDYQEKIPISMTIINI